MGRMGSTPILAVRQSVTIGTTIKLDGDGIGDGDGVGMCKQSLNLSRFARLGFIHDNKAICSKEIFRRNNHTENTERKGKQSYIYIPEFLLSNLD